VGGQAWAKFGLFGDYWKATGSRKIDRGRIDVTGKAEDLYVFKAPVLRNVAMTPPYFHDGSVARLEDAVRIMARVQLNRELSDGDIADLTAFLHSLTGPLPASFSAAPVLPSAPFRAMASDAPQRQ
jgi:cytochrome c peroxidase